MTRSGHQAFLKTTNFSFYALLIGSLLLFSSCDEEQVVGAAAGATQVVEVEPDPIDNDNDNDDDQVEVIVESADFAQDFEGFSSQKSWFLSDFGITSDSERSDYVSDNQIKFNIFWTKRARNLMADRLNLQRSQMTHEYTNSICEPKVEVGKENVYTNSDSENHVAELDSDLSHCGISGKDPATISLRSFIPTKIGYKYKLNVTYKMRTYSGQVAKSYKDLVVRFGSELEKFDPVYDNFTTVALEMTSTQKFSKLVLTDNGLPDSYGVLIDDVEITELGKAPNYDTCAALFQTHSKGFKKCVKNEVNTEELCQFDSVEDTSINYKEGSGVSDDRKKVANAFVVEPPINGKINFLALGLKGRISLACRLGGYPALFDIYGKTLSMREVSWGNATPEGYPELAKVRVKLEDCDEEVLNRVNTVGSVQTNESFSITFDENEDGLSYSGCKMSRLIIKDITPTGPSKDGFDLNSVQFTN